MSDLYLYYLYTTIFDKTVEAKFRRLSIYSPVPPLPGRVLKHQISFLGPWGHKHWDRGAGRGHALQKISTLQTQKGGFQCIKIYKITALQRSDFQILFQLILSKIIILMFFIAFKYLFDRCNR